MRNRIFQLLRNDVKAKVDFRMESSGDDELTLYIYDVIDEFWGVNPEEFVRAVNESTASVIHVRINSPGGEIFGARAMQTALKQSAARVIAHIDGLAASSATFLPMGADEIRMAEGAFFMIHNAWSYTAGNGQELRALADTLEKVDVSIVNDYIKKTGADRKKIEAWMAAETWFSAEEALDIGFIDSVFDAANAQNTFNLDAFENTPKGLLAADGGEQEEEIIEPDWARADRLTRLLETAA